MLKHALPAAIGPIFLVWLASCTATAGPVDDVALRSTTAAMDAVDTGSATDPDLNRIVDAALADGYAYDKLGELCDTVGHRLTGSPGMKRAITWALESLRAAGFDSVWTEPVKVPHWTRGREWARCVAPVPFELDILSMGLSDGTGGEPLEAEVLAVRDWDELETRAAEAAGKIVLFNPPWEGYGKTVQYRVKGASVAAITPDS